MSEPTRGAERCPNCGARKRDFHECSCTDSWHNEPAPPTAQARPPCANCERLERELAEARHHGKLDYDDMRRFQTAFIKADQQRDQAREQRDKVVKALRKVDGMVVSSFDGPRGGPAHQIHAEIQSTLAALEKEQG